MSHLVGTNLTAIFLIENLIFGGIVRIIVPEYCTPMKESWNLMDDQLPMCLMESWIESLEWKKEKTEMF